MSGVSPLVEALRTLSPEKRAILRQRLEASPAAYARDPLAYVKSAYPWGEPRGVLAKHPDPDTWQAEILAYIGDRLNARAAGKDLTPIRIAVAGGVGPGKSALAAWLVDWGLVTMPDTRIRVTANTGPQITTATWPEITKWRRLSRWSELFESGDRRIKSIDQNHRESWRCDAITWDEHRPEAFAGFHNAGR